ncbi:MAG: hypothetical protein KGJ56_08690 [Gammaproteobacteria bacterium]|nr:hypothetical protein [Gammaproteobacteria bacterium]MDE2345952.1 hypothetical protein [Gammaproteobacteria bacterium]
MKAWQMEFENRLGAAHAPPVLDRDLLARMVRSIQGRSIPASSLSHWLKSALARKKLTLVQRGLYLNGFRTKPGTLADAAGWLRRDAVVSLNTVLGDAGVLNNPSRSVTALVPMDGGAPPPLGRKPTAAGELHFFGVPRRILEAGAAADRLQSDAGLEHVRATPEKALVDWLYLAASPRSHRTWPPRADVDISMLDERRLRRLAQAAGMKKILDAWLKRSD